MATLVLGCEASEPRGDGEAAPVHPSAAGQVVLLTVGDFPREAIAAMEPLASWLEGEFGDLEVVVKVAPSVPAAASMMKAGAADVFFDSLFPVLLVREMSGCQPVLRWWKYGSPTYRSVIFVREDSAIQSLEDLEGRTLAFEDRYSSSSFFMPVNLLFSSGLEGDFTAIEALADAPVSISPGRVGFVFSGADSSTIHWVLAGKVDAGATNEFNLQDMAGGQRQQLRVVATTEEVTRSLVAIRRDLDPQLARRVTEALVAASETPDGRSMLERLSRTAKFDLLPRALAAELDELQAATVQLDRRVRVLVPETD